MREDRHLHWHDASVIFEHAEILGKARKGEQLLTLSLLLLLHVHTRAAPTPPPCTQQKEEGTGGDHQIPAPEGISQWILHPSEVLPSASSTADFFVVETNQEGDSKYLHCVPPVRKDRMGYPPYMGSSTQCGQQSTAGSSCSTGAMERCSSVPFLTKHTRSRLGLVSQGASYSLRSQRTRAWIKQFFKIWGLEG